MKILFSIDNLCTFYKQPVNITLACLIHKQIYVSNDIFFLINKVNVGLIIRSVQKYDV